MIAGLRCLWCALALGLPAWHAAWAGDPLSSRTTGRVLLLDSNHILEGEIERVGDQYRVRRAVGESWVPGHRARFLADAREEIYGFLRSRANLRDADERLRLARWCQLHGLRDQALEEFSSAVELRPGHEESRRLLRNLQRSTAPAQPAQPPPSTDPEPVVGLPAPVEVSAEALSQFATRVQPLLMNACSTCHATGRGGAFKLVRPLDGVASRKAIQQNLAAALAQVTPENPHASPLLSKAVSAHGDKVEPPLKHRQLPAYKTLEDWVQLILVDKPRPREAFTPSGAMPEPRSLPEPVIVRPTPPAAVVAPAAPEPQPAAPPPTEAPGAAAAGSPGDPFDPAIFNQQMRPEAK